MNKKIVFQKPYTQCEGKWFRGFRGKPAYLAKFVSESRDGSYADFIIIYSDLYQPTILAHLSIGDSISEWPGKIKISDYHHVIKSAWEQPVV